MKNLDVKTPTATVTINSGVIENLSSSTSDYTLVLKPGVTVNNLNVVAGNILVHKGASIKNITKDPSNQKEILIYTMGHPNSFKQDVPAAQSGIFDVLEYKASNVLTRGGKMVMFEDAKLAPVSSSEYYGELDLNGHTLNISGTLNSAVVAPGQSLKVYNGSIRTTKYENQEAAFKATANSTLSFDKVNFETAGTCVFADGENAHIIVNGSEFKGHYTIATNASTPDHMTINLKDSKFDGNSTIFVNVPCDLNIDNCDINGKLHGVIVRGGNANIINSRINQNYVDADFETMSTYFDGKDWGTGNTINLAGLVIGNKNTTAYKYPTTVNLKNTEITVQGHDDLFPTVYAWSYEFPVTFNYDEQCKFNGRKGMIYDNGGANITVNGKPAA